MAPITSFGGRIISWNVAYILIYPSSPKSVNYLKKEYEIESPITMEDKLSKIEKERLKTQ